MDAADSVLLPSAEMAKNLPAADDAPAAPEQEEGAGEARTVEETPEGL
jgi:hypothetical protein